MVELKARDIDKLIEVEQKCDAKAKAKITDDITRGLQAARKLESRKETVMNVFFDLTGIPMTEAQFRKYNKIFDNEDTPAGYNIKSFIRDEGIIKNEKILNQSVDAFLEGLKDASEEEINEVREESHEQTTRKQEQA